jgi:soluble lytic murein transglycosylase-like protein
MRRPVPVYKRRLSLLIVAAFAAVPAYAQETDKQDYSAYRLDPNKNAAFRLNVNGNAGSGNERDTEAMVGSAISAQLADKPYAALIHKAAHDAALNPALVHAVIEVESGYNATARSSKGAIGLMQLMPATAARYGVRDPGRSPEANIRAGTRYLSDLMQQFDGRMDLALAAYNAGENAVVRHGMRIPPYPETQHYVPAVLAKYHEWDEPPPPEHIQYIPGTRLEN